MEEGVDVGVAEVAVELMVRVVLRCRRRVEVCRIIFWKRGKQAGELVEVNIAKCLECHCAPVIGQATLWRLSIFPACKWNPDCRLRTARSDETSPGDEPGSRGYSSATHNTSCSALFGFISGRLPSVHGSYCAFTATPLPHPISQRSHAGLRFSISQAHQMPAPVATKMRTPFLFKQPVWVSPPSPT